MSTKHPSPTSFPSRPAALSVKLQGNLNLEVGIFLGNAQPSDKLTTTTPLANLNEPLILDDNQRYTADVIVGKLELGC